MAQRSHLGQGPVESWFPLPGLETEARGGHTQASRLRAEAELQAAGQQQLRPPRLLSPGSPAALGPLSEATLCGL